MLLRQGTPPHATYLFKHALVQDAAPGEQLHAQIAEALDGQFPEIAENGPEQLARHFAEAGQIEKAARYWLRAGRNAAPRYANVEVVAHLRRGIEAVDRLSESAARDRLDLDLQLAPGPCIIATQGAASTERATGNSIEIRSIRQRFKEAGRSDGRQTLSLEAARKSGALILP